MSEPNTSSQLTLEQQFNLRAFQQQVDRMSPEQAREFVMYLYTQLMLKDAAYKAFFKNHHGI